LIRKLQIPTARVFVPLLEPARYKGAHGGRGSGKSHFFAEKLIDDSLAEPGECGAGLNSVCIREIQKDLNQSSKLLIENKISAFRLRETDGFKIFRDVIQTPGDGLIIFKGMNDYNGDSIKSLEGFKRSWWEEAQTASLTSLNLLTPTIRAPGSEKWFSWNPRKISDPVDKMLRGIDMPTGAVVVESNWRDNPFFTDELEQERKDCLRLQPDQYDHIWEGGYIKIVAGAYFAAVLTAAKADGRLSIVGEDPLMTHRLFFDIGGTGAKADAVAIWDTQFIGKEIRNLKYYEAVGQPLATHIAWMRENDLTPDKAQIWLPHDGSTNDKVYDVSYQSALEAAGYTVTVVPNQGKGAAKARIESVRRTFPNAWFNKKPDAEDNSDTTAGLEALGWYHEKKDQNRDIGLGPEHDWSSHGSDAYGLMSVVYEAYQKESKPMSDPYESFRGYASNG
jgi:phage terminase large subunit